MMMMMEGHEEALLCKDQLQQIIKGKRTKRSRPVSPLTLALTSSTSSSSDRASGSTTTSVEPAEEEEDMAYCLMLLAQGDHRQQARQPISEHRCKTCNRCFSSFQALGGHRASHKKPKVHNEETTKGSSLLKFVKEDDHNMNTTLSLRVTNKAKSKVHECSICGAEFSSGQALGGHMRRHRTLTEDQLSKKPRSTTVLQLDLNLPAPEDHDHGHHHHHKEKLLAFSSSNSLVDCHY